MADLQKKSVDLSTLLPKRFQDKTINTLLRNLFNKHLTKNESQSLYGYIGDKSVASTTDVYLTEPSMERQINQLTPMIYAKQATVETVWTWQDLLQKLIISGVDYNTISDWLSSTSFNFAPPIDLDKFCNFNEYLWVGNWLLNHPTLPFEEMGIPKAAATAALQISNPAFAQEYYVIGRGQLDSNNLPVASIPTLTTWADWALCNLWVHREDVFNFYNRHTGIISLTEITQASRPIIEYFRNVKLNTFISANGAPADSGSLNINTKSRPNQPPMFDMYFHDGSHAGVTSSLFYYQENSTAPIDPVIGRRLQISVAAEYTFSHTMVNATTQENYFYKLYDSTEAVFDIKTFWQQGAAVSPEYVKYDTSGDIITIDKINNFANYYWTGSSVGAANLPSYNQNGYPDYYVIDTAGVSDWAKYNYWVHVSALKRSELKLYIQATRPIVELNHLLEPTLIKAKTVQNEIPRFQKYAFSATQTYAPIPTSDNPFFNDSYINGIVFARLADLPLISKLILNTTELAQQCFTLDGEQYIQGLFSGYYAGTTFATPATFVTGVGNGSGSNYTIDSTQLQPQVLVMTAKSATSFSVYSTILGNLPDLAIGTLYASVPGVSFRLQAGTTPFVAGDIVALNFKTSTFTVDNLYVLQDGAYRTFTSAANSLVSQTVYTTIPATPALRDGSWEVPDQLKWNTANETRVSISQGDLYFHFTSIIKAQPGLIGSESGQNNWRTLTNKNAGLGGTIKQYDGRFSLLVGILLQDGVTMNAVIDFAQRSYEQLLSQITVYAEEMLPSLITSGAVNVTQSTIDPSIVSSFMSFYQAKTLTTDTNTTIDTYIAEMFYDTTSGLPNAPLTLPYLGLATLTSPQFALDGDLNLQMIVHHDGHETQIMAQDIALMKKIVQKPFLRSNGQQTAGVIGGLTYPANPFRGQFWYDTIKNVLYFYDVVSDTGEHPTNAAYGAYSYDRLNNVLYQYNGVVWDNVGSQEIVLADPWTQLSFESTINQLTLAIEEALYDNCPPITNPITNATALMAKPNYTTFMQSQFESFGVKHNVTDVYGSAFDQTNAFTWNYSQAVIPGISTDLATWQSINLAMYGTSRPDYQPWFIAGFNNQADFLNDLIAHGLILAGTTVFAASMWTVITGYLKAKLQARGVPTKLSINITDGSLLPPFGQNSESLLTVVPQGIANRYIFGQRGPVELLWTKSLDYLYSRTKTFFKLDPMGFIKSTWGDLEKTVDGYEIDQRAGRKIAPADIIMHGTALTSVSQQNWVTAVSNLNNLSNFPITYNFTMVSRQDGIFQVTGTLFNEPVYFSYTNNYADPFINVTFSPGRAGFNWGDLYTFTVDDLGNMTSSYVPQTTYYSDGINQLLIQYYRSYSNDISISLNLTYLKSWIVKLGYRFGGLINNELLQLKVNDAAIADKNFTVFLKENKYSNSSWLNALRVQVAQRGSSKLQNGLLVPAAGQTGQPGDDWVFRIDTYNPRRTDLSWYTYDPAGDQYTFLAEGGVLTTAQWIRYTSKSTVSTFKAPFLITGLQNLITFLYGYADYVTDQGWLFNDPKDQSASALQNSSKAGWNQTIEAFISTMFSGIEAGAAYSLNPFTQKVWFQSARGVVTDLTKQIGLENEALPAILDVSSQQINTSQIRVFRDDDITQLIFDKAPYVIHVLTSEYEHVTVLDQYAANNVLIYDPFLGQAINRIFVTGERQLNFNGRLSYGGQYLSGGKMSRNMEATVENLLKLYDTSQMTPNAEETKHARGLLGFQNAQYFADRGSSDKTEFRYWQGMISNKGTNLSIDAFLNSSLFKTSDLDEYWAYRVATYGNAASITKPEIKMTVDDCTTEFTNYLFIESNEFAGYSAMVNGTQSGIYSAYQQFNMSGNQTANSLSGVESIIITGTDETRWFSYDDVNSQTSFTADVLTTVIVTPTTIDGIVTLADQLGHDVQADAFEITDSAGNVYFEKGENITAAQATALGVGNYVTVSDGHGGLIYFTVPAFTRLNNTTIKFNKSSLIGQTITVRCYGPSAAKYSPLKLYDYVANVVILDNIILWDPARGIHHPEAIMNIDVKTSKDPAHYTSDLADITTPNNDSTRLWGDDQVGKVWWNTSGLSYKPYTCDKVFPSSTVREAIWGALTDFSSVEVYEWISSPVAPANYIGSALNAVDNSMPAIVNTVSRNRTWYVRPVAWRYSATPGSVPRTFAANTPVNLYIDSTSGNQTFVVLNTGRFSGTNVKLGSKMSLASYSSSATKTDATLKSISGLLEVTSAEQFTVGSSTSYTVQSPVSTVFVTGMTYSVYDQAVWSSNPLNYGTITSTNFVDSNGNYFIQLLCLASGVTSQVQVTANAFPVGGSLIYRFPELGIQIQATAVYASNAVWGTLGQMTAANLPATLATIFGNPASNINIRSTLNVNVVIPFIDGVTPVREVMDNRNISLLVTAGITGATAAATTGWIAWNDPTTLSNDLYTPYNQWSYMTGAWVPAGNALSLLGSEISADITTPFTLRDGTIIPKFSQTWSNWTKLAPTYYRARYYTSATVTDLSFWVNNFSFNNVINLAGTQVFVDGSMIAANTWNIVPGANNTNYIIVGGVVILQGSKVVVKVPPYAPTAAQLAYDPTATGADPLVTTQYAIDYPYSYTEKRNVLDQKTVPTYYFWVKGKSSPANASKTMSISLAANLLTQHDGNYAILQKLKYNDQLNGLPYRYGRLGLKNMGLYIRKNDTYKLRMGNNSALRNTDNNLSLKNVHNEWVLIRSKQSTVIPKTLWDLLIDSVCGVNAIGQSIPSSLYQNYDARNGTMTRYGFGTGQTLVDSVIAIPTIKYTILNTTVHKYDSSYNAFPDYISYPGFDITQLDSYFATPISTRAFLTALWINAAARQINEIFFAVLTDALTMNYEVTDFFKTSIIAMQDVRIVSGQ